MMSKFVAIPATFLQECLYLCASLEKKLRILEQNIFYLYGTLEVIKHFNMDYLISPSQQPFELGM